MLNSLLILACPLTLALHANVALVGNILNSSQEMLAPNMWKFDGLRATQGQPTKKEIKELRQKEALRKKQKEKKNVVNSSLVEHYEHNTGLLPQTWLILGPFRYMEYGVDPLRAFGGIWDVVERVPQDLWKQMKDKDNQFALELQRQQMMGNFNGKGRKTNLSYAIEFAQRHQLSPELQNSLEAFPTEFGPGGRTVWALAYADRFEPMVFVNFTATVDNLGSRYNGSAYETWSGGGWAVGLITVPKDTTVLVKCTDWFHLESGQQVMQLPDIYDDQRAIHSVRLTKGSHRMFVNFRVRNFWCDVHEDSESGRRNMTGLKDASGGKSPFIVIKGSSVSDVVAGKVASPHLGIPVLNSLENPLHISRVEVVGNTNHLSVSLTDNIPIAAGLVRIVPLRIEQNGSVKCETGSGDEPILNFTVAIHPSNNAPPATARLLARCVSKPDRGFLVAYPDFDGSIQVLWTAPPNVTRFTQKKCPPAGCPVLLSLHGADVELGTNWGRNYEYDGPNAEKGKGFPYPAWLVEPSNRGKYGSDWEDQGFDNALSALNYVRDFQPGVSGNHADHKLDKERILITGHSMGGHGCFLFATHFPDSLVAAACGAGWTSMESYTGLTNARLLDGTRRGALEEKRVEHSADYLSSNLRGTPIIVIYGSRDDNVPPTESRYMARLINSASANRSAVKVSELEGTEHWFVQDVPQLTNFLEEHLKPSANESESVAMPLLPETFEFTVTHPATFGTKGFLQLLRQVDTSKSAKFFVQRCTQFSVNPMCNTTLALLKGKHSPFNDDDVEGDPIWDVETVNVERFSVQLPKNLWKKQAKPKAIRIDGTVFLHHEMDTSGGKHFCRLRSSGAEVNVPRWGICNAKDGIKLAENGQRSGATLRAGPLHMVLRQSPICIVHGSGEGQKEEAQGLAFKMYYVSRYATPVVDGSPQAPANITWPKKACENANLILLGNMSENTWTERYRCAFPYVRFFDEPSMGKNSFAVGGNSYTQTGSGLLAIGSLPNGRIAMLIHGIGRDGLAKAAYAVPVASGKDDADFFVFGPDYGWMGLGGVLASGSLDPSMHIAPSASGWAEPEHSVAMRTRVSEAPLELSEATCKDYVQDNFVDVQDNQQSVRGFSQRVGQGFIFPLTIIVALAAAQ